MPEHRGADFAEVTRSVALRRVPSIFTVLFVFAFLTAALGSTSGDSTRRPRYPDSDMGADSLPARKKAQLATVNQLTSGIRQNQTLRITEPNQSCEEKEKRPIFGYCFPQIFDFPNRSQEYRTLSRTRSQFVMFLTRETVVWKFRVCTG